MAAAYAALVSLINTIAMERTPRPSHPPIPFDGAVIEALLTRVEFLVEFLEQGWKGAEHLEGRISDLAYAAEDAIESPIVDQILAESGRGSNEKGPTLFCQDLETIIQEMESIKAEMMHIKERSGMKDLHLRSPDRSISSSSAPRGEKTKMVGFEEEKIQIMEDLAGKQASRGLVAIAGMGGIGKTTLARNIYDDELIVQYFDVRAWVTISQEYSVKMILAVVHSSLKELSKREEDEEILGEDVHKGLWGRRYLIVLDDIWDISAWNAIQRFFPNNENGSRIMVTTRLSNMANELGAFTLHQLKYLNEDNGWKLLCEKVFSSRSCPVELEEIGKRIANNCRGLPLAIGVIGGLLAKSETLEYWEDIEQGFNSSIYLNDEEHCLNVLSLSYNHLPVQLKPWFLYMGVFPEDAKIKVSKLTKLWVAEGFIKPVRGKVFEEIAEQYVQDLIDKNLIMVHARTRLSRKVKSCTIHDSLRELCLREAEKENLLSIVTTHNLSNPQSLRWHRRIFINLRDLDLKHFPQIIDSLPFPLYFHSLIVKDEKTFSMVLGSGHFKLLRVLFAIYDYISDDSKCGKFLPDLINLRYLAFGKYCGKFDEIFAPHIGLFRNLQFLDFECCVTDKPFQIWNLQQLRQIEFDEFPLAESQSSFQTELDCGILENLQSVIGLQDFTFDEVVLKRIPNVKELGVVHVDKLRKKSPHDSNYHAQNLCTLQKLETFDCYFDRHSIPNRKLLRNLSFPDSIKKLTLVRGGLLWKDMTMIGSLPNLEVLKLKFDAFTGSTWNPIEGEFIRLKSLSMKLVNDLKNWNADSTHFPVLEQLFLKRAANLKEIPMDIGNIPSLQLIDLCYCTDSVIISAKRIVDEQLSFGNDGLLVKVYSDMKKTLHDSLVGKNFAVKTWN